MHTNVIQTNKRRTHVQSNYTNTKPKAWFRRLIHHLARKRSRSILHPWTHKQEEWEWVGNWTDCSAAEDRVTGTLTEV